MPKVLMLQERDENLYYQTNQEDFRVLAIRFHAQQQYGGKPYAFHLAMVEDCLVVNGYDSFEYRAAGWLHDVIEDTSVELKHVRTFYGNDVAMMVDACSGEGPTRAERNASIYRKINEYHRAAPVKVADRICNMKFGILNKSTQLAKYINEFEEFSHNLRPIMTQTRGGALMWNKLEDTVVMALAAR